MKTTLVTMFLLLAFFVHGPQANEESSISIIEDREVGEVRILEGRLTGYGARLVAVNGQKFLLCKDCQILDDLDNPITVEGLGATEVVRLKIQDKCVTELKVTLTRK